MPAKRRCTDANVSDATARPACYSSESMGSHTAWLNSRCVSVHSLGSSDHGVSLMPLNLGSRSGLGSGSDHARSRARPVRCFHAAVSSPGVLTFELLPCQD